MCLEYERTVANNYVIRFETRLFQSLKTKKTSTQAQGQSAFTSPVRRKHLNYLERDEAPYYGVNQYTSPKNPKGGLTEGTFLLVVDMIFLIC